MKYLLIVCVCLSYVSVLAQDRVDLLYLKSGETLRGRLQNFEKDESIVFILSTGDTIRSEGESLTQIKGIRVGKKNRSGYNQKTVGFWHHYELGVNLENEGGGTLYPQGAFQASLGYQWGKMKKLGVGIGLEAMEDFNVIPIYLSIRGDWFEKKVTPFHFLNVGYVSASARSYVFEDQYREINGGFRLNPGLGIKIHKRNSFITISAGYLLQNIDYQENIWGGWWADSAGISETSRSFRRMSFRVGIGF